MFTIISRIIHFGFKNFKRNGWLSTATVAIMVLALVVFLGVILFGVTTNRAASSIQDKIDVSVFFNTNTSEDQVLNIQQSLEALPQVASVNYTSRDQALANFTAAHTSDQTVSQALSALDSNPLEASLEIKAKDPSQYGQIADYLNAPNIAQFVDTQSYTNNENIINRLAKIVQYVEVGGLGITLILALIAGLVVFNTIQLAIYSNREEIGIMRVVGASNALVRETVRHRRHALRRHRGDPHAHPRRPGALLPVAVSRDIHPRPRALPLFLFAPRVAFSLRTWLWRRDRRFV